MVVFIGLAYLAFGWLILSGPPWLQNRFSTLLGENHSRRLLFAYLRSQAALFPADSDRDGVPDIVERLLKFDSSNPQQFLDFHVALESPGLLALPANGNYMTNFRQVASVTPLLFEPGERRRVRARLLMFGGYATYSPSMKLRLTPHAPGLIALPGGTPSPASLGVPVSADGLLEFDLAVPADAPVPPRQWNHPVERLVDFPVVDIDHAASKTKVGVVAFALTWKKPPVACTVEETLRDDPFLSDARRITPEARAVWMRWPVPEPGGQFVVEATCDESGNEWMPIALCGAPQTWGAVGYIPDRSRPWGPPKFRVVPVSDSRPER